MDRMQVISPLLREIYEPSTADKAIERIANLIGAYPLPEQRRPQHFFSHQDAILITYGGSLRQPGNAPLAVLKHFADNYLRDTLNFIHILPFFPFSSDDGFAVKDFTAVDPALGSWADVIALGKHFGLMFDWVLNHISAQSDWFKNYLSGKGGFEYLAIEMDPATDLSLVTRPRTLPLLTSVKKEDGQIAHLWTTFSADQIDLNYADPEVLIKMLEVLLLYVKHGAAILRLDAVAYLWKQVGTTCIHLPQAHALIRLFRAVLDQVAPQVALLTETNVPHEENISYFGSGHDEAQMVYNFSLPPLLAYTLIAQDSRQLSRWASSMESLPETATFFNFTASHDGVGLRPLEGILSAQEMAVLLEQVRSNGGQLSFKNNSDGSQSPYEMNITYLDLLHHASDSEALHIARFLASQSIALAFPGVPGIYIHSLLGSRNWQKGVEQTGRARSINRQILEYDQLTAELADANSLRSRIFFPLSHLIKLRRQQPAFHPRSRFQVLDLGPKLFGMMRFCDQQKLWALTNVSSKGLECSLSENLPKQQMRDLITGQMHAPAQVELLPYQTVWLTD